MNMRACVLPSNARTCRIPRVYHPGWLPLGLRLQGELGLLRRQACYVAAGLPDPAV
jgi:hypothetical protein